ncbi:hypothetical protein C0J52_18173 [Blattella germanica]|nr:hypothetical protein C0J52_18173 [Blattella germanica]
MSENIGSHTFTNAANGSLIQVDVGLHEDIDYDFFDSVDNTQNKSLPKKSSDCFGSEETLKDKKSSLKISKQHYSINSNIVKDVPYAMTSTRDSADSVVRFSNILNSEDKNKKNSEEKIISPKQDKHAELKNLMNCIAFDESKNEEGEIGDDDDDDDDVVSSKVKSLSPDFLSLSTDTTSEITDVTTRPSSSGCSSMSKHTSEENLTDSKESKSPQASICKKQEKRDDSIGRSSMKLLIDALDSFEKQEIRSTSSNCSSISSTERKKLERRNMSFSNDQCRKIERENEILLRKLENLRKPRPKPSPIVLINRPRLSSSAINRRKQQMKIEHENMVS